MFDVAVVGSVNLDLVATTPRLPGPGETVSGTSYAEHAGGKGLNQAIAAARSRVPRSRWSLRSATTTPGVSCGRSPQPRASTSRCVAVVAGAATGRALITVDEHAENSIVVVPGRERIAMTRRRTAVEPGS